LGTLVLCGLAGALAVFALTRRRLLLGVIGVGAHSLALAGVYLFLSAPDVALAEASIGFGLVTFIFLLALRRSGRLVVAAVECFPLLYQEGDRPAGLEWEILARLGDRLHREVHVLWVCRGDVSGALASGEAELAAGGFLVRSDPGLRLSRPVVPTRLVEVAVGPGRRVLLAHPCCEALAQSGDLRCEEPEELARALCSGEACRAVLDLLTFRELGLKGAWPEENCAIRVLEDPLAYRFAVAPDAAEVHQALEELLAELEDRGVLADLVRRYLG